MQDLTTGSLSRHLVKTMSFALVSMVFQTLYVLIDLYWVARLGTDAVAAVAVSSNLIFIVVAATQMLSVGTTTMVAHAVGRKDRDHACLVFNQSQVLCLLVALLFLAGGMAFRTQYAQRLSADTETATLAAQYLLWFIPAMALQFSLTVMAAAMRGAGNFKPGMIVQSATIILNIVLAPVLVFGWGTGRPLGVAGAAIATFVAVVIGVAWLATYFAAPDSYLKFHVPDWRPRLPLWKDLLGIGVPAGAEFALLAVYLFMVYAVIRPFGAAAQAGFGIGLRIIQASFLPVVALGFAVGPVAGQNFGARRGDRVRATFYHAAGFAVAGMVVAAAAANVAGAAMVGAFSSDPAVIAVGEEYLRVVSWSFAASGIIFVSSSMFQAMGNTMPALIASFTRLVAVSVPVLLLARTQGFALRWVWDISVATILLQMVLILLLLRREFRTRLAFSETVVAG